MAVRIVVNAKAQRPGVCNAAETLLVHRDAARRFLPCVADALQAPRGRAAGRRGEPGDRPRAWPRPSRDDWDTEYLDLILAVGVVDSLDAAIAHIGRHGSGHTEAILTRDLAVGPPVRGRGR